MQTFIQYLIGVEGMTPEKQLWRIKQLMGILCSDSDLLESKIKCPKGQENVSIKELFIENKEFLVQALNKEKKELDGEAKQELDKIIDLMKRMERV